MKPKETKSEEFKEFETLAKNLLAVSNVEVRKKLEQEKQAKRGKKKPRKKQ